MYVGRIHTRALFHTDPPSEKPPRKSDLPRITFNGSAGLGASGEGLHGLMGITVGIAKRTSDSRNRWGLDVGPVAVWGPNGKHSVSMIEFLGVSYERKLPGRIRLGAGMRLGSGIARGQDWSGYFLAPYLSVALSDPNLTFLEGRTVFKLSGFSTRGVKGLNLSVGYSLSL